MFLKISDNSTINQYTFRGAYDDKFYINVFGIYRTIDLSKHRGVYFCLNEMRRKIAEVL